MAPMVSLFSRAPVLWHPRLVYTAGPQLPFTIVDNLENIMTWRLWPCRDGMGKEHYYDRTVHVHVLEGRGGGGRRA